MSAIPSRLLCLSTAVVLAVPPSPAGAAPVDTPANGPFCLPPAARSGVAPEEIRMTPARRNSGAEGVMAVRLASSPYGVAVRPDGSYRYRVEVILESLPAAGRPTWVVWAATPELDRHTKLGTLEGTGTVAGTVSWNKFLVFVTAETSAEVERWSQRFVLSAVSPSGRMHTMAGHGPFSGEPCLDPRP